MRVLINGAAALSTKAGVGHYTTQLLRCRKWHPADRAAPCARCFLPGIRHCAHFLAISESARQEIIRHLGVHPGRVTRTWMGVRPGLRPLPADTVQAALRRLGLPPR